MVCTWSCLYGPDLSARPIELFGDPYGPSPPSPAPYRDSYSFIDTVVGTTTHLRTFASFYGGAGVAYLTAALLDVGFGVL